MIKAISTLAVDLAGPDATINASPPDEWMTMWLASPSLSIRGGTDEIQHNIIGERLLGLPPEQRADKGQAVLRTARSVTLHLDPQRPSAIRHSTPPSGDYLSFAGSDPPLFGARGDNRHDDPAERHAKLARQLEPSTPRCKRKRRPRLVVATAYGRRSSQALRAIVRLVCHQVHCTRRWRSPCPRADRRRGVAD